MKVMNREELILAIISSVMQKDNHVFGTLEPMGSFTVSCGAQRKINKDGTLRKGTVNEAQFIRGNFAIPHEAIASKYIDSVIVISESFHMPTTGIPKGFASVKLLDMAGKREEWWEKYSGKRPRIAAAMKELLDAVVEEIENEKERMKRMNELENVDKRVCTMCAGEYWISKDEVLFNPETNDITDEDFLNEKYTSKPEAECSGCPYCGEESYDKKGDLLK